MSASPSPQPSPSPSPSPLPSPLVSVLPAPADVISSIHSAAIDHLAVTEDGTIAVTSDTAGGLRLWPALDGSREPVVVTAAHPAALAIIRERDHGDLVIADLDPAGVLEVVRTSSLGAPISRVAVTSERPYTVVRATSHGLLALRDDQLVDILDLHGARFGQLTVPAGQRIADILVRRDAALAILVAGSHVRARWITLDGTALEWGATSAVLHVDPSLPIVLAPDHRRITGVHDADHVAEIFELATGHAVQPPDFDPFAETHPIELGTRPVGFVDNETLVRELRGDIDIWQGSYIAGLDDLARSALDGALGANAVTDHHLVAARSSELAFVKPGEETRSLGYRMPTARSLRVVGGHVFVGDADRFPEWTELDDDLAIRRVITPPGLVAPYLAAVPIDAKHGLALTGSPNGPTELVRYKFGTTETEHVIDAVGARLEYSDAQHLAAVETALGWAFVRVDPATGALGKPIEVSVGGTVHLVDPARAHGHLGVVIVDETEDDGTGGRASVTPILGLCSDCRDHLRLGKPQHVMLDYGDRDQIDNRHDLVHVADLTPFVATSPDHTLAATFGRDRITLRDASGSVRWTIAAPGVSALVWTPRGELLALANGVVKLDLETGAFAARHCGWLFGVSSELSFETTPEVACDAS